METSDAFASSIRCMPRTTLDIDAGVLRELKRLQERERKPLGQLVSELLAQALAGSQPAPEPVRWRSAPMGQPMVDLDDKDAVWDVLDER
jgi:hypothetical protein